MRPSRCCASTPWCELLRATGAAAASEEVEGNKSGAGRWATNHGGRRKTAANQHPAALQLFYRIAGAATRGGAGTEFKGVGYGRRQHKTTRRLRQALRLRAGGGSKNAHATLPAPGAVASSARHARARTRAKRFGAGPPTEAAPAPGPATVAATRINQRRRGEGPTAMRGLCKN